MGCRLAHLVQSWCCCRRCPGMDSHKKIHSFLFSFFALQHLEPRERGKHSGKQQQCWNFLECLLAVQTWSSRVLSLPFAIASSYSLFEGDLHLLSSFGPQPASHAFSVDAAAAEAIGEQFNFSLGFCSSFLLQNEKARLVSFSLGMLVVLAPGRSSINFPYSSSSSLSWWRRWRELREFLYRFSVIVLAVPEWTDKKSVVILSRENSVFPSIFFFFLAVAAVDAVINNVATTTTTAGESDKSILLRTDLINEIQQDDDNDGKWCCFKTKCSFMFACLLAFPLQS